MQYKIGGESVALYTWLFVSISGSVVKTISSPFKCVFVGGNPLLANNAAQTKLAFFVSFFFFLSVWVARWVQVPKAKFSLCGRVFNVLL